MKTMLLAMLLVLASGAWGIIYPKLTSPKVEQGPTCIEKIQHVFQRSSLRTQQARLCKEIGGTMQWQVAIDGSSSGFECRKEK